MIQLNSRSILDITADELRYLFADHDPPDTEEEPVEEDTSEEETSEDQETVN